MVYARTLQDRGYSFQVSGKLWRNSLIIEDRESSSSWSHVTGEAIAGPAAGQQLEKLPSVQTTWARWQADHPDTEVLAKTEAVTSSHYQGYFDDPERLGMFRARWLVEKMPGKELIHGAALGPHAVAVRSGALEGDELVAVDLGEAPVVVVRGGDGGVRAFIARVGSEKLSFEAGPGSWRDQRTGSLWDLERGRCTAGKRVGLELEPVAVTKAFWFAWSSFYPNTKVAD